MALACRHGLCGLMVVAQLYFGVLSGTASAAPEYRLQPGDTLAISVAGFPELAQRVTVQIGGWLSHSLIGRVEVAGLSTDEAQDRLRGLLPAHTYQRMLGDGQTMAIRISPEALVLDVAVYRPVYVDGDVVRPGEQAFRPGLLIRQAVALAGGYDVMRPRMSDSERFLDAADLRGEAERLSVLRVSTQAQIERLRTLLEQRQSGQREGRSGEAPADGLLAQLSRSDAQQLALAQSEAERERAFLEGAIRQADEHMRTLRMQQQQENDGREADLADYERLRVLQRQGTANLARVSDARRSWQYAATQSLQTATRIAELERERARAVRDLDRLNIRHRLELEQQLTTALVEQAATDARLAAVRDKLRYITVGRNDALRSAGTNAAAMTVHRGSGAQARRLTADENSELLPGDVLEVRLEFPNQAMVFGQ